MLPDSITKHSRSLTYRAFLTFLPTRAKLMAAQTMPSGQLDLLMGRMGRGEL